MKKLLLILSVILSLHVSGQSLSDSIQIINNKFYQHDLRLSMSQLQVAVSQNAEALELVKKARSNTTIAAILSYPGGFLIGYPIGTAIGGGDPNWLMAGIGAGLILIAIPISVSAQKTANKAVSVFNESLKENACLKPKYKPEINIGITQNGIGVIMRF